MLLTDLTPPECTECGQLARLVPYVRSYRRGGRVLAVESGTWECAGCPDPLTGARPFRFADAPLLRWTDARAAELWSERFGEPLPPSERGKRSKPPRTERVPVMLTLAELARLDAKRGDLTRSDYLRKAI
jgi:hypothetical protein